MNTVIVVKDLEVLQRENADPPTYNRTVDCSQ